MLKISRVKFHFLFVKKDVLKSEKSAFTYNKEKEHKKMDENLLNFGRLNWIKRGFDLLEIYKQK